MEAEGKIGDDDGAGLGPAQGDLVIGLGIGPGRMQAEDRQPLGGRPAQGLAPDLERAADHHQVETRHREGLVEVLRHHEVAEILARDAGVGRRQPEVRMRREPAAQACFLRPSPRIRTFIAVHVLLSPALGPLGSAGNTGLPRHPGRIDRPVAGQR